MGKTPYRDGVVAVVTDERGGFLVGERSGIPGAWQFPQGGIDAGETAEAAILREVEEEIGTGAVEILARSSAPIAYAFPPPIAAKMKSAGQSQIWFLLRLRPGAAPDVAASDGEFRAFRWAPLREIVDGIVEWKRAAYVRGLESLGLEIA